MGKYKDFYEICKTRLTELAVADNYNRITEDEEVEYRALKQLFKSLDRIYG
ncbi:MAG: hypothetical protein GTN97_08610 [Nitrosopumilaceae archaeon]|nr:hypothetical protein [Nitrosopumilaceae archaeon]